MIEMASVDGAGTYRRGVAGDTFNTAVYLARQGCRVSYLSQLGDDAYSTAIIQQLVAENIDTTLLRRVPGRQPGLYLIDN